MLRFVIDNYEKIEEEKVIFIHNHDGAWHYPGRSIWDAISSLVKTDYFWDQDFGDVLHFITCTSVFRRWKNRLWAEIESDTTWVNMADIIDYLFKNTSMDSTPRTYWEMTCCATFFLDTRLLWQRSLEDNVTLLRHINELSSRGFCSIFRDWPDCSLANFDEKWRKDPKMTDSFIVGQTMEKIWGVVLANRTEGPWMGA